MKKRLSFILIYLCLLSLLTLGAGELLLVDKAARPSEAENRMLQGFPEFSRASVSSGAFMDGVEGFLSDGFFFRKDLSMVFVHTDDPGYLTCRSFAVSCHHDNMRYPMPS